jgi:hypothetical protein
MNACEAVFSHIVMVGELTDLDREILEYYSAELKKHLRGSCDTQEPRLDGDASEYLESPMASDLRPSFFDHF